MSTTLLLERLHANPFNLHNANDDAFLDMVNATCADVTITELASQAMGSNFVSVCTGFLSITAASIVAALMYTNKPLMQHPNRLIFGMCICEAAAA